VPTVIQWAVPLAVCPSKSYWAAFTKDSANSTTPSHTNTFISSVLAANSKYPFDRIKLYHYSTSREETETQAKMSGHCHDEHHDHSHGGEDHDHSDDITPALQFSLYQHINFDEIVTMNEAEYGSGKAVCKKTWAERMTMEPELASDADEQILVNIPYVGSFLCPSFNCSL